MEILREGSWYALLTEAALAGVYALISLMMVFGAQFKKRGLMIPYLVFQMLVIVVFALVRDTDASNT